MKTDLFQKLLTTAALALAIVAKPACALDVHIGDLAGVTFAHGQTYAPGAAFADTFHFDLSGQTASFSAVANQLTLQNFFNISNFSLTLAQPAGPTLYFTPGSGGGIATDVLTLLPGIDYIATFSGLVDGTFGGGYTVLLAAVPFQVAAIPEPSSFALLLAGIAFFAGRRLRRTAS